MLQTFFHLQHKDITQRHQIRSGRSKFCAKGMSRKRRTLAYFKHGMKEVWKSEARGEHDSIVQLHWSSSPT